MKNADGTTNYDDQANENIAKNLKGHLLLAHGTMDDNVPPYNTLLVVDALIKANKDFDLLLLAQPAPRLWERDALYDAAPLGLLRALFAGSGAAARVRAASAENRNGIGAERTVTFRRGRYPQDSGLPRRIIQGAICAIRSTPLRIQQWAPRQNESLRRSSSRIINNNVLRAFEWSPKQRKPFGVKCIHESRMRSPLVLVFQKAPLLETVAESACYREELWPSAFFL